MRERSAAKRKAGFFQSECLRRKRRDRRSDVMSGAHSSSSDTEDRPGGVPLSGRGRACRAGSRAHQDAHRDIHRNRKGGETTANPLASAPGGSLGASEEGRPLGKNRPRLPRSARDRLAALRLSPFGGWGTSIATGASTPSNMEAPPCLTSPITDIPFSPFPAATAVPLRVHGGVGRVGTTPLRFIVPGRPKQIAPSSPSTVPLRKFGRTATPTIG